MTSLRSVWIDAGKIVASLIMAISLMHPDSFSAQAKSAPLASPFGSSPRPFLPALEENHDPKLCAQVLTEVRIP
jgi:hypothetical protein